MPLKLDIAVQNPDLTTLEALKVDVQLANDAGQRCRIPGPQDQSGALSFEFHTPDGELFRRVSGLTHQAMMTSGRVSADPDLEELGPKRQWKWTVDLASYHYALPQGEYELEAVLVHSDKEPPVRSGRSTIHVAGDTLAGIQPLRDNPVIDGTALMLKANGHGKARYYLRQHNTGRPLAAWYCEPVNFGDGAEEPFCATPNFFCTDSFDHFFRKWILWRVGASLCAQELMSGIPQGKVRKADLPNGVTVLRSAYYTEEGDLHVFLIESSGKISCCAFDDDGVHTVFEHEIPWSGGVEPAIRADCDDIHVAVPAGGVLYDRLTFDGALKHRIQMFRTRLSPHSIDFDPVARRVKAMFWDPPHGKSVHMVAVGPTPQFVAQQKIEPVNLLGELSELSFDCDQPRKFHLLVSTNRGKLYYYSNGRGPILIARGEDRFFPLVAASKKVYLGFFERAHGYRYCEYNRLRPGPKLIR